MLWLLKALAKISKIDYPSVGVSFNRQTGCICRSSCRTPLLILFELQMSLFLSLISVGEGD